MIDATRRDFCLWVVGPKDGKVRKLRLSLKALVLSLCAGIIVAGGFLFIASDYFRVQIQRAQTYLYLKRLSAERDQLIDTNVSLETEVQNLQDAREKALSYEQEIKLRLSELAALIDGSEPGKLFKDQNRGGAEDSKADAKGTSKDGAAESDGMGGAEIDCSVEQDGNCSALLNESPRASLSSANLIKASLSDSKESDSEGLIKSLDQYIQVLKKAPLGVPAPGRVSSGFGYRSSPFHGGLSLHEGVDFALPHGNPILATGDGIVKVVKRCATYGLMVDIAHSNRVVSRYAHLSKITVTEGAKIARGDTLGLAGSTGRSTGPHLHYEVLVDNRPKNPIEFMKLAKQLQVLFAANFSRDLLG